MSIGKLSDARKKFKKIYKRCKAEGDSCSLSILNLVRNYGLGILINYPDTKHGFKIEKKIKALDERIKNKAVA